MKKKSIFWKKHRPGVGSDLNDNVCAIFIIQVTCKNLGGHLAVIETPQENEFVSQEAYASPGEYISILYPPVQDICLIALYTGLLSIYCKQHVVRSYCSIRIRLIRFDPWYGLSNNVVCVTSKTSDQPAHTRSLITAFASRLNIL